MEVPLAFNKSFLTLEYDLNSQNKKGETPLHLAVFYQHYEYVKYYARMFK